ncbi:MAG: hypothetical protein RSE41_02945 [Clostridia bacterium]
MITLVSCEGKDTYTNLELLPSDKLSVEALSITDKKCLIDSINKQDTIITDKDTSYVNIVSVDTIYMLEYKQKYSNDIVFTHGEQVEKDAWENAVIKELKYDNHTANTNAYSIASSFKLIDGSGFIVIDKYYNGCDINCDIEYDIDSYGYEEDHYCNTTYYAIVGWYEYSINKFVERNLRVDKYTYKELNINKTYTKIGILL